MRQVIFYIAILTTYWSCSNPTETILNNSVNQAIPKSTDSIYTNNKRTVFGGQKDSLTDPESIHSLFIDTTTSSWIWNGDGSNTHTLEINIGFPDDYYKKNKLTIESILQIDTITKSKFLMFSKPGLSKTQDQSLATLNLHADWEEPTIEFNISHMYLVDNKTGKSFYLPSCSDEGPREVLISPQNNYLLTYSNSELGSYDNCCIYVCRINKTNQNTYTLKDFIDISFYELLIEKLVWIDNRSFAIEVTKRLYPPNHRRENIIYFKVTIKK